MPQKRRRNDNDFETSSSSSEPPNTTSIFDLFRKPKFDESIRRAEYRSYTPFIKAYNCNDIVEFNINQVDSYFAMNESQMSIAGKLEITGTGNVSLAPNFAAFLFDSCTYSESAREIETVRDPGIVSTIRAMVCYEPDDSSHMAIAGWNYPDSPPVLNDQDKSFSVLVPLKHIFNIFNDYPLITCGRQTLRFVRARNDADCVIIQEVGAVAAGTTTVKVVIESIELKIKHIYPNDEIREQLMRAIQADEPIVIPFRKWELNELPAITKDAKREIWSVKTSTAVERPRFVVVCFQTDKRDAPAADPTSFDHVHIQNIRLSLNGEYWPNERMQLDFQRNHYTEAHFNYTEFLPSYTNMLGGTKKSAALLDYASFKDHALFVIDCSKQEERMKSSTVDVRLDIEASVGFPEKTRVYCIIIHDCLMEYFPLTEVMRNLS